MAAMNNIRSGAFASLLIRLYRSHIQVPINSRIAEPMCRARHRGP